MEKYFDIFLNFIVSPKETIQQIKHQNYIKFGTFIFILAILCLTGQQVLISKSNFVSAFLLNVCVASSILIAFTSWVHFVSSFFSDACNIKTSITVFLMCFSPLFFSFPLAAIFATWMPVPFFWYLIINFLIFVWIVSLFIIGIKNIYSLNKKQVYLVVFSPLVLIGLFVLIFLVALSM